ncbi:hypothetical protein ACC719_35525, partial [Rhizobium ruizarguesonis]
RSVAADSMSDPAKAAERTAACGKIFTYIMADAPWIPVINERRVVAKSLRMGGAYNIYIDPTLVINYDAVGHFGDDAHIVGDEDDRGA